MPTVSLTLQNVNGDPFVSGGNINITTGTTSGGIFFESGAVSLSAVQAGDSLDLGGLTYNYDYLGSHDVRGDPLQPAAYIRIVGPLPPGATLTVGATFAIDLTGQPGDADYPNLQNGNTRGSVADLDATTPIQFPGFICFEKGTMIATPQGPRAVEDLVEDDLVTTMDNGAQPIRWIGNRRMWVDGDLAPIVISTGVLENTEDLIVSPAHRILMSGSKCELLFGSNEVLVAAGNLLYLDGVYRRAPGIVEYYHILFDAHEIIFAAGQPAESLHIQQDSLHRIDPVGREEILTIFPELRFGGANSKPACKRVLRNIEVKALFS